MTSNPAVLDFPMWLNYRDCDLQGHCKLSTLLTLFTEVAGIHYVRLGLDRQMLLNNDFVFLLNQVSLQVHEMPTSNRPVVVRTWAGGYHRLVFFRNFELRSDSGELLVSARSSWVLVHPHSRVIVRPEQFPSDYVPVWDQPVAAPELKRLKFPPDGEHCGDWTARYGDIDCNHHVNNAVYAEIACNQLPLEVFQTPPRQLQLHFAKETLHEETLQLYRAPVANGYVVKGARGEAARFTAEIIW